MKFNNYPPTKPEDVEFTDYVRRNLGVPDYNEEHMIALEYLARFSADTVVHAVQSDKPELVIAIGEHLMESLGLQWPFEKQYFSSVYARSAAESAVAKIQEVAV